MSRYLFSCACDGLVHAVLLAGRSDWQPYLGDTLVNALAQLRIVLRQGRALGLIPSREELGRAA